MSTGWGSEHWGSDFWGGGIPSPEPGPNDTVSLRDVNVWSTDLIELVFTKPMRNDTKLKNTGTYTIYPVVSTEQPVTVLEVRSGTENLTLQVFLVVSHLGEGVDYFCSIDPTIKSIYNVQLSTGIASMRFHGQRTKLDNVLSTRPQQWDLRPGSTYRNILNAISHQDHLIGGDIQSANELLRIS